MEVQSHFRSRSRQLFSFVAAASLALGLSCAHVAHADDGDGDGQSSLQFAPGYKRFTTTQYALTLGLAGGAFASNLLMHPSREPHWKSGILFDGQARSLLAASTEGGRNTAGRISDYLTGALLLYPFVVDSLFVAGGIHGNMDVAFQMTMINMQAVLLSTFITGLTKNLFSRQRPDAARCIKGTEAECGSGGNQSFLSGHTSTAFASAGLICAHHQNLPLYGDGAGGKIACGLSLAAATAVGTLRVVADRHHMTDVLAGAALGLATGYLLPNLINYDFGKALRLTKNTQLYPIVSRESIGVGYMGTF